MWKSVAGHGVSMKVAAETDDWETDPDFENDVSEQEQRWGAKTVEGSGRMAPISVAELRETVSQEHQRGKERELAQAPKASYGYGGKFGVEKDRMDKGAMGHDFVAQVEQHSSQTDAAHGFGGKFGVQKDRVDKSALGFEHKEELKQHTSQKDHSKGFGGKYGVEKDRVDQAAVGYDYKGQTEKHQSQKDYSKGFGGRYGVQTDRIDKSASSFTDMEEPSSAYTKTQPVEASSAGAGKLKARFENMAKASGEENKRRVDEERERRRAKDEKERLETQRRQQKEREREEQEGKEHEEERQRLEQKAREENAREEEEEERAREETERREQEEQDREALERQSYPPPLPGTVPQAVPVYTETQPKLPWRPQDDPGSNEEEEPEYEEPPADDFLDDAGPLPRQQPLDDEADYEDIEAPPPAPDEADYEELTCSLTAKALYSYQEEADDEITFDVDDIITNIEMVDEGWWKGQCGGRSGLFPASYVQMLP